MTGRNFQSESLLKEILARLEVVKGPDSRGEYIAWCPFHEDGKGKPPHQPNLYINPEKGFICHACGEYGSLKKLAERIGAEMPRKDMNIEKTYDYTDENGTLLYQVVRMQGKEFPCRRPVGNGNWEWNLRGVQRVLYKLPDLIKRQDETVFIAEGEKDTDRLHQAGLLATTNPNGAGKWRKEYSETLKGRDVVIIPDNDAPGMDHAAKVAKSLARKAHSIKIVELPGLPEHGDVSDWLDAGHTTAELTELVHTTPLWDQPDDEPQDGNKKPENDKSQADILFEAVINSGIELFRDEREKPHAVIPTEKGRHIVSMDSSEFNDHLSYLAYRCLEHIPNSEIIGAVKRNLMGMARFQSTQYTLHSRVAWHDNAIWIDKDGYKAIRVTEEGWGIVDEPPILFRTFPHQKPMPDPVHGGDPRKLVDFVNVHDDIGKLAIMCYITAAMVPDIPCNILILYGGQGTAKSTLLRVIKMLLDPSELDLNMDFKNLEQFILPAWQSRMINIDNMTSMPLWLSNALCCTVTGAAQATRSHYTMEQLNILKIKRVIGLSGINLVAERPDLLERSTILGLDPIPPQKRCEESEFWEAFTSAYPSILGGFLDVLSKAMRIHPTINLKRPPRMKDFARWGAAAAVALDHSVDEYQEVITWTDAKQNEASIDASSLAQMTIAMLKETENDEWYGTPLEFLNHVTGIASRSGISTNMNSWPKNPIWAVRRLNEIKPTLQSGGIEVDILRSSQGSMVHFRKVPRQNGVDFDKTVTVMTVNGSSPENTVTLEAASDAAYDGNDDNDGIFSNMQVPEDISPDSPNSGDEFDDIRHLLTADLGKPGEGFEYGW